MPAFGGAVIVHMVPEHEKAGKIVRAPMVFPWVLDVAVETWRKQKQEQNRWAC